MNRYIQLLHDHLSSQPMDFHDWDADTLLDFIFCCYTADHPLDNDNIRRCYAKLEPIFDKLPNYLTNQLFQNIAELCIAYEQTAFIEGLRIGVALEQEVSMK